MRSPDRLGLLGCVALASWAIVYWAFIAPRGLAGVGPDLAEASLATDARELGPPAAAREPMPTPAKSARAAADAERASTQRLGAGDVPDGVAAARPASSDEALAPDGTANPKAGEPPRTHTVVSGDTLASIAARYLGSEANASRIFEANRDTLSDPDVLRVGQVLRIPAR